jgi:predicted TPR repeat methyltransferase
MRRMADAGDALRQAVALHQAGRLDEARALYGQILRADERNPNALNLLGMVHHAQGRHEHAAELIGRAISAAPQIAGFHNNLGTVRLGQRRCADAEQALRHAIDLQPDYVEAANNLAVALMGQGRMDEAIPLLLRCLELRPVYPSARNNLGNALRSKRMYREAVAAYSDAITQQEDHAESWANLSIALLEMRDLPNAETAARRANSLRPDALGAYYTLGITLEAQKRREEAIALFRRVLAMAPHADVVRFHLASLTGEQAYAAVPPEFVAGLFDQYADTFDRHLVEVLHYRGHELVVNAVEAARAANGGLPALPLDIVDLGCGTGLAAPLLQPLARTLVGVDLSPRMIHQARQRKLYDELVVGELTGFLADRPARFDLAVAADVFSYMGDLAPALAVARAALRPGGLLAFTVEKLEEGGADFRLEVTRRFRHALSYLRSAVTASGMDEVSAQEAALRTNSGQRVDGWVMVLRKGSDGTAP